MAALVTISSCAPPPAPAAADPAARLDAFEAGHRAEIDAVRAAWRQREEAAADLAG